MVGAPGQRGACSGRQGIRAHGLMQTWLVLPSAVLLWWHLCCHRLCPGELRTCSRTCSFLKSTVSLLTGCAGFAWGRVNFLRSSWYGAMFCICAENRVDNTEMLLLSLSSAYTESRPFLLLTPPCQRVGWGCTRSWEGTQPGQLTPTDQTDIPYHMASCSAIKSWGKKKEGGGHSERWHLSSQVTLTRGKPCFPGDG